jgi:hypothetical protein
VTETKPRTYEWAHGWIPLTLHAAILKAHGNHEAAERLLAEGRHRRAGGDFTTPLHEAQAAHHTRRVLRDLADDDLADAMGAEDVTDAELDALVGELDRRDRAARKAAAERARRARRREHRDRTRDADYDRRVDAGEDPEAAYAAAYGVTEERVRRDEAITSLRSSGYRGKGLDDLCRAAFRDHVEVSFLAAEAATNGYHLNRAGEAAGIDPRSLFTGPEARARKYASEDLLTYWQAHGRLTVDDFRAGVLGGHMRAKGAAAWH